VALGGRRARAHRRPRYRPQRQHVGKDAERSEQAAPFEHAFGRLAEPDYDEAGDLPLAHRLDRVEGQVQKHPLQLQRIGHHAWQALLDLRLGDLREPPVAEKVPLVISPFRALLHLLSNKERLLTLTRIRDLLKPDGRFVFDVFSPSSQDIAATHGRWIEREPEIFERADWDAAERRLTLRVRAPGGETSMDLAWLSQPEWNELLEQSGFSVEACYGWFDRSPYDGGADMVFIASGR